MERDVVVYVDLEGTAHFVGRLWARMRKNTESATFEYDKSWLAHADRFSLEPALKLGPGPFHTPAAARGLTEQRLKPLHCRLEPLPVLQYTREQVPRLVKPVHRIAQVEL